MHRFFVPPESIRDGQIILPYAQAHQVRNVLRLHPGQAIEVLDNSGDAYRVQLEKVDREDVRGRVLDRSARSAEPRTRLILYQSLLKAEKFEWVLQKCTEIGVSEFVPVSTGRVVTTGVGRAKYTRWQRILIEAAEQSGRSKIPLLHPVQSYGEALAQAKGLGRQLLMPWEEERSTDLRASLHAAGDVQIFVGPEGGWSAAEIDAARTHGALTITLGPRILRAETAGLVVSAAILFARGEMDAQQQVTD